MIANEYYFMEMEITVPKGRARPVRTCHAAQGMRCSQARGSDRPGTYPHLSSTKFLICQVEGGNGLPWNYRSTVFKQEEEKQSSHLDTC